LAQNWQKSKNTKKQPVPIGTGRLLPNRIALSQEFRDRGIGTAILESLLNVAKNRNFGPVYLSAQISALLFYEKTGSTSIGEVYTEVDNPHQKIQ
jgi:predicted GNAT family N-acyltransferase